MQGGIFMYNQSYEEYIRSILGYPNNNFQDDIYQDTIYKDDIYQDAIYQDAILKNTPYNNNICQSCNAYDTNNNDTSELQN